jgi:predicted PurR-regulated permease PerM
VRPFRVDRHAPHRFGLLLGGLLRMEYVAVDAFLARGPRALPAFVAKLPWLGEWLQQWLDDLTRDPAALRDQIGLWVDQRAGELLDLLGGVGRNVVKLGLALVTILFMYRDGETLLAQARKRCCSASSARASKGT